MWQVVQLILLDMARLYVAGYLLCLLLITVRTWRLTAVQEVARLALFWPLLLLLLPFFADTLPRE